MSDDGEGKDSSLNFEKATLIKNGGTVLVSDIKQMHNGKSFFEFIPSNGEKYTLDV